MHWVVASTLHHEKNHTPHLIQRHRMSGTTTSPEIDERWFDLHSKEMKVQTLTQLLETIDIELSELTELKSDRRTFARKGALFILAPRDSLLQSKRAQREEVEKNRDSLAKEVQTDSAALHRFKDSLLDESHSLA